MAERLGSGLQNRVRRFESAQHLSFISSMIKRFFGYYSSPIGGIKISASKKGITSLKFIENKDIEAPLLNKHVLDCIQQLEEYFQGQRKIFKLKLDLSGSLFQRNVWRKLRKISFGKTTTYSDISKKIGNRNACRAVGMCCKLNKIPIIIPCHRVISKKNKLVGFNAGLWRKEYLLQHEGCILL